MVAIARELTDRPMLRRSRQLGRTALHHGVLIVGAAIMVYPLVWMVGASLKPEDLIFSTASPILWPLHFKGYVQGWTALGPPFALYFLNSLIVCGGAVVGNLFSCSLAAFAFARLRFPLRGFFFAIMIGTLLLPFDAIIVPQYILFKYLGLVGTFFPLILPKFFGVDAFFVFLLVQFIRGIPRELDDAALVDGCRAFHFYWRIVLPLAMPALATTAIFTFIFTYNDFFSQLIYISNVNMFTVPLALRQFIDATSTSSFNGLFAMSALALVPVFGFFLAFQRLLVEGIATTGLQ